MHGPTRIQVAAIAASIKEWGWTTPALVGEDGGLIAGHARILAARQLGIAKIPVMVAAGWTEAQKRAYVLAGPTACCDQLAGDRPGLFRGQEDRDERDLRSVHHAADGIAPRRVRSEVLALRLFRGYAQLGGAGGEQARRALGAGRAGMDAIDRDPMTAQLDCQRFCHVSQGGIAGAAAEIAGVAGVAAADVDDAAPARRLHEGNDGAGTAQRSDIFRVEILQQILVDAGFSRAGRGGR